MHLNVWLYAYRMMEAAVDQCEPNCIACNDKAVHTWDGAMAFYTGSLEGEAGSIEEGLFPHNQADKRCADFNTCGPDGTKERGTALSNYKIFRLMQTGQSRLLMGDCDPMRDLIRDIVAQMSIMFIQGALRYAQIMTWQGDLAPPIPEKAAAEGVAFAAAIVPRIAACPDGEADAELIWENMKWGSSNYDFAAIKSAFERHYHSCLNITCAEVGGFFSGDQNDYFDGAEPCVDPSGPSELVLGLSIGGSIVLFFCMLASISICYLATRERQGTPVFTAIVVAPNPIHKPTSTTTLTLSSSSTPSDSGPTCLG